MKSNAVKRRLLREELRRIYGALYKTFADDLVKNTLATTAVVLMREFNFTEDDIRRLQKEVENEFLLMETGALGKEYKTTDPAKMLKEKGIDFDKSYVITTPEPSD